MFADSLHLTRSLIKAKHPSLIWANNKPCNTNMSSLYQCLFEEQFPAHDALEDVKALRRILFSSPLDLQDADVFEKGNTRSAIFAFNDMKFLDKRHQRMHTFSRKLYNPGEDDGPVKLHTVQKIAESGLSYSDLEVLFQTAGTNGLVVLLAMPPSCSASSRSPRRTRNKDTLAQIVSHFTNTNTSSPD